jgi:hypothetical protein
MIFEWRGHLIVWGRMPGNRMRNQMTDAQIILSKAAVLYNTLFQMFNEDSKLFRRRRVPDLQGIEIPFAMMHISVVTLHESNGAYHALRSACATAIHLSAVSHVPDAATAKKQLLTT